MISGILRVLVRAVSTVVLQVAENIFRNTNLPIEKPNYALFVSTAKINRIFEFLIDVKFPDSPNRV